MHLTKHHNSLATWLMVLTIMLTPWLSFWTTPVLANSGQGKTVVLCTLEGLQRVVLDKNNTHSEYGQWMGAVPADIAEPADSTPCAAIQLEQAFSQSLPSSYFVSTARYYPYQSVARM